MRFLARLVVIFVFFFVLPQVSDPLKAQCAAGLTWYSCRTNCTPPQESTWGGFCYDPNGSGGPCNATCFYPTPYTTPYTTPAYEYPSPYGSPYGTPYTTPTQSTPTPTATPTPTPIATATPTPNNQAYGNPYTTPNYPSPQVSVTVVSPSTTPTPIINIQTASGRNKSAEVLGENVASPSTQESAVTQESPETEPVQSSNSITLKQGLLGLIGMILLAAASNIIFIKLLKK